MLITHVLHKHVQLSHSLKHIQHSCVFICQAMNLHEVCTCRGGMRISPARVCRRLSVRVRLQLRAFMTQWVLDPVIPAEGGGAGSPQCYSSCPLSFPSPLISSAPLPSLPLMPSQCFPFRLLLCFPSITPAKQAGGGRWRPGVAVRWGASCLGDPHVSTAALTSGTKLPSAPSDLHVFKCL